MVLPGYVEQREGLKQHVRASRASRVRHAYYIGKAARRLGQYVRNDGVVAIAQRVENDTTGTEEHTRRVGVNNRVGGNSGAVKPSFQRN